MGRRRRTSFGDVKLSRAAFDSGEGRCASCRRPIGPADQPTFVRSIEGGEPRLATMRCGRCQAMLTLHFEERDTAEA